MTRQLAIALFSISLFGTLVPAGCRTQPPMRELEPIKPRVSSSTVEDSLRAFAHRNQGQDQPIAFGLVHASVAGVDGQAPLPEPVLERVFSLLRPAGFRYLPQEFFFFPSEGPYVWLPSEGRLWVDASSGREGASGDLEAILRSPLGRFLVREAEELGQVPDFYRMKVSVYFDRNLRDETRGAQLRALATVKGYYVEPEVEVERGGALSRLNVTITLLTERGDVADASVSVSADLLRTRRDDRFALFIAGSGGNIFQTIMETHGLGEAMHAVLGHATLVLCARLRGVDYGPGTGPTPEPWPHIAYGTPVAPPARITERTAHREAASTLSQGDQRVQAQHTGSPKGVPHAQRLAHAPIAAAP